MPSAGVKRRAIARRTDLRSRSERTAFGVKRMRTLALPLAPTLAAPEPSFDRFSVAVAVDPAGGAAVDR